MRTRFKLGSRGLLALSAAAVLASWPASDARAAWVGPVGHNEFVDPNAEADGHVSYAVWQGGSTFWSQFGLTAPTPAAASSEYVYVYQVVNSDPAGGSDTLITLTVPAEGVTAVGWINEWVFNDVSGAVGPEVNGLNALDDPSVVSDTGTSPVLLASVVLGSGNAAFTEFVMDGGYSPLLWFTSNFDPGFVVATLQGETTAYTQNFVASAVPVPASLILVLSGLPMALGFGTVWRRRQQLPVTA